MMIEEGVSLFDQRPHMPINQLHQIEITSRCNLRCRYCVHPKMPRAKEDMDRETFERCLHWVSYFASLGTQSELNIAGIGESTLHPDFLEYASLAAKAIGKHPDGHLILATNGVAFTEEMAEALSKLRIEVWVSAHRPERAAGAVELCRKYKLSGGVSLDPVLHAMNWAGQVDWHESMPENRLCKWMRTGSVFAMSDGRITACCLDGTGDEPIGHVEEDLATMHTRPYRLCMTCDQRLEINGWDQEQGKRVPRVSDNKIFSL